MDAEGDAYSPPPPHAPSFHLNVDRGWPPSVQTVRLYDSHACRCHKYQPIQTAESNRVRSVFHAFQEAWIVALFRGGEDKNWSFEVKRHLAPSCPTHRVTASFLSVSVAVIKQNLFRTTEKQKNKPQTDQNRGGRGLHLSLAGHLFSSFLIQSLKRLPLSSNTTRGAVKMGQMTLFH